MSNPRKVKSEIVNTVKTDGMDKLVFGMMKDYSKVEELCADDKAEGLTQDVFTSFYSHHPEVLEEAPMAQRGVIESMMALPEFEELRAHTALDDITSSLSTIDFVPGLMKQMLEVEARVQEEQKKREEQGQDPAKDLQEALGEGGMSSMRKKLREGLKKAQDQAEEFQDAAQGFGVKPGELKSLPVDERMKLAEKMKASKKLQKVADLAGRFCNVANSTVATSPTGGADEICDITLSRDISHILPSELVKLRRNRRQFMLDYIEGKLMTYELRGVEEVGRGPIIACLDISGSMSGSKEEWSKAVILSLMHLAQKQKRAFGFLSFDTKVRTNAFWHKDDDISLKDKVAIAELSADGGGTAFYEPLLGAFKMRGAEPELNPADIIFITDGDAHLTPSEVDEIKKLKTDTKVRIFSVGLAAGSYSDINVSTLEKFSDDLAIVNSLGEIESVKSLMASTLADQQNVAV